MTDFMHVTDVAHDLGSPEEPPESSHVCTLVVFMALWMTPIAAGVFGLAKLTFDHGDPLGRGILIFASLYSFASFVHFLVRVGRKALNMSEPRISRAATRFIRSLDAFFGRRSWCSRRLRVRGSDPATL